jgi:acetyl esterase/lipase
MRNFLTLLGCLAALLLAGCAARNPATGVPDAAYRGVVYKKTEKGEKLALDLYVPREPHMKTGRPTEIRPAPPLVVWFHGGGWRYGHRRLYFLTRRLTEHGFAVATVSYRLSWRDKWPAQEADIREALEFLETHGEQFNYDPTRIGLAGGSAGGHLASYLALTENRPRVDAVMALYPATDLVILGEPHVKKGDSNLISDLLGGKMGEPRIQKLAYEASPVNYVSAKAPPFLFIHGSEDPTVPLAQSELLDGKLRAAGVESRVIVVPGADHGFGLDEAQLAEVAKFFHRHLDP